MQGIRRVKSFLFAMAAGVGLALAVGGAQASLVGTNVGCSVSHPDIWSCSSPSATIGAGSEFQMDLPAGYESYFDVDFGANSVTLEYVGGALGDFLTHDYFNFSNLNGVGIVGLTLSGFVTGLGLSDISLVNGLLQIDLGYTTWVGGATATITFNNRAVPEPATLGLLAAALGGVVVATGRRRG